MFTNFYYNIILYIEFDTKLNTNPLNSQLRHCQYENPHSELHKGLKLKKKNHCNICMYIIYEYMTGILDGLMKSSHHEYVRWKINYNIKSAKECNLFSRWFCDVIKCVASACIKSVQCPDSKSGILKFRKKAACMKKFD